MKTINRVLVGLGLILSQTGVLNAAPPKKALTPGNPPALVKPVQMPDQMAPLTPESLSAKMILEGLMVRRYSQDLATLIDGDAFTVAAQLDLAELPPRDDAPAREITEEDPETNPPFDLWIGTLDVDQISKQLKLKKNDSEKVHKLLSNYQIRFLKVTIGLKNTLQADAKTQVETWLKNRLNFEMGKNAMGTVAFIQEPKVGTPELPKPAPPIPKSFLDRLGELQALLAALILASALVLAVILWKLLVARTFPNFGDPRKSELSLSGALGAIAPPPFPPSNSSQKIETIRHEGEPNQRALLKEEIQQSVDQINELATNHTKSLEQLVRFWNASGVEGKMKVAAFAEVVGRAMGKLPLPQESLRDLSEGFSKMPQLGLGEKLALLQKVYWDFLAMINLGSESLDPPFGYLGGMNLRLVKNALLDQNPKLKTLVSLYMPADMRQSYFQTLSFDEKRSIIRQAAELSEIPMDELKFSDRTIKDRLSLARNSTAISLDAGLGRLKESLSPMEEVVLMGDLTGEVAERFARSTPSLAFLGSWQNRALSLLLTRVTSDELAAYLRLRPDLRDRLSSLAPQMTQEMVEDELSRPDRTSDADKNRLIASFNERLKNALESQLIDLNQAFGGSGAGGGSYSQSQSGANDDQTAA